MTPFGAAVTLSARASDGDGTVAGVEFFADGADVGAGAGQRRLVVRLDDDRDRAHQVTAVATDNDGLSATSAAVPFVVDAPPAVAVTSPAPSAALPGGSGVTLTATASAAQGGAVTGVRFFADGLPLGAGTYANGAWSYAWAAVPSGTHSVTAVATDGYGTTGTSPAVSFTVQTNPVITATTPLTISAGHVVNVQALASGLGTGTPLTTRYAWDFGDTNTGSQYNTLIGFNAAHLYDTPGTYTVTLTVTDGGGYAASTTATVVVNPAPAKTLYVAASGDDVNNNGLSPATPFRTFARALKGLSSNTTVLFNDGDTFGVESLVTINNVSNVTVGSYGVGANPTLLWDDARVAGDGFFQLYSGVNNFTVRGLTFDSVFNTDFEETNMPFAVRCAGSDVAVVNDTFLNVGTAVDASLRPVGLLVENDASPLVTGLRAYFTWVEGSDVVIVGNTVANSTREHVVRVSGGGATRVLVEYNNFANVDRTALGDTQDIAKATIAAQNGSYLYAADNTLRSGPAGVGPLNRADLVNDPVQQASNFQWSVFDGNTLYCPLLLQPARPT